LGFLQYHPDEKIILLFECLALDPAFIAYLADIKGTFAYAFRFRLLKIFPYFLPIPENKSFSEKPRFGTALAKYCLIVIY
jgi:hypothetical protein